MLPIGSTVLQLLPALTVGGLEVAMDEGDGSFVVQVVHAIAYLDGPVDQHVRQNLAPNTSDGLIGCRDKIYIETSYRYPKTEHVPCDSDIVI